MQQFYVLMTFNDIYTSGFVHQKCWILSPLVHGSFQKIILRDWLTRLSIKAKISFPKSCLHREVLPHTCNGLSLISTRGMKLSKQVYEISNLLEISSDEYH